MFVVGVGILTIVIGTVLPILVGIVTKEVESRKLKGALLILLSSITGLVASAINSGGVFTTEALVVGVTSYLAATAAYYGVWKPQGVAEYVQKNIGRTD